MERLLAHRYGRRSMGDVRVVDSSRFRNVLLSWPRYVLLSWSGPNRLLESTFLTLGSLFNSRHRPVYTFTYCPGDHTPRNVSTSQLARTREYCYVLSLVRLQTLRGLMTGAAKAATPATAATAGGAPEETPGGRRGVPFFQFFY